MIELPFVRRPSRHFGELLKPLIPVRIAGPGWAINVFMLLDSGADLSMLPYSAGEAIGLWLDMGTRSEVQGIEEGAVPYIFGEVDLQSGKARNEVKWSISASTRERFRGIIESRPCERRSSDEHQDASPA